MQNDILMRGRAVLAQNVLAPEVLAQDLNADNPSTALLVERLTALDPSDAAAALLVLPRRRAVAVCDRPEFLTAAEVFAALPRQEAAAFLADMSADRATDVLGTLAAHLRNELLARIEPRTRATLKQLLAYPVDTAGGIMTTEFVALPETTTVAGALAHIRTVEQSRETIYAIYVVDGEQRLTAAITLRRLIAADPSATIISLSAGRPPVVVRSDTDRETVAATIRRHDLLAVPVVNDAGHILGIVTVDDVLDAIIAETTEDVHKFGGLETFSEPYLQIGFLSMIRKRAGWLCALFLSEMLTASAMQHFEAELERAIVLTLFIPLIMSSGGNSGSQATSLLIRALALGQVRLRDWWRVVLREMPAGLTLGIILGTIGIARISIWQGLGLYDYGPYWMLIAATVGAGLIGIVTFGSMAGAMLPFILQRLGFDPASASAPFVATLVDVTGLIIYFSVATVILSGTLL
ncbi:MULTISPECIES: magnesium transporter [unclassified Chelatococcus]|uniref:magnesium transporter n=1 Tax=unclassified Chelatococcus TaxID=2638111 RepID=UPI0020BD582D|nr:MULTISPECIES: magnesium transporter [unclassified Chelatococcus]MCO5076416.1 magnesium transporter [Chelatococcus sp.]CAH1671622.1 Magnesium transporter MgtE [Hyphomicrobiales bacterium]CAH1676184.1 Magnesium transporter MgtE [Hyphomicrobiales bacterium]